MFLGHRGISHQIICCVGYAAIQVFLTRIHTRQNCAAQERFERARHRKSFICTHRDFPIGGRVTQNYPDTRVQTLLPGGDCRLQVLRQQRCRSPRDQSRAQECSNICLHGLPFFFVMDTKSQPFRWAERAAHFGFGEDVSVCFS